MRKSKAEIAEAIEREYVNGDKSLCSLAKELGYSQPRLSQIGRELVPGYAEATERRRVFINKLFRLQGA